MEANFTQVFEDLQTNFLNHEDFNFDHLLIRFVEQDPVFRVLVSPSDIKNNWKKYYIRIYGNEGVHAREASTKEENKLYCAVDLQVGFITTNINIHNINNEYMLVEDYMQSL